MTAAVLRRIGTDADRLERLCTALGSAGTAKELIEEAWRWFNQFTEVDVIGVTLLGPPTPGLYLYTSGQADSDTRDRFIGDLVSASAALRPEPGAYPQRAADMSVWDGEGGPLPAAEPSVLIGQWALDLGGAPAAVVRLSRFGLARLDPDLGPYFDAAAQLLSLYLRALGQLPGEEPTRRVEAGTFEDLLEVEVANARLRQTAMSLVLIEVDVAGSEDEDTAPTEEELAEVEEVVRRVVRGNDKVVSVWDGCLGVLMPKTDARGALIGADRVKRNLLESFSGTDSRLSFWIGIGGREMDENEGSELFSRASQALAQARTAQSEAAFVYV